jgi:ribonuclease HI
MHPLFLPADRISALECLAHELHLGDFDLLLVGDGAGSVYTHPAGWACGAYDRRKQQAVLHAGAVSGGTNNFAELAPFIHALGFHHQDHGQAPAAPVHVAIVRDSEGTVRCGNGQYARRANGCLWAAVAWFEQHGYRLAWHHVRRDSNPWNTWADGIAEQARMGITGMMESIPIKEGG